MDGQVRLDEHKKRLRERHSAARPKDHLQYSQAVDAVHSQVQTAVTPPAPTAQPAMNDGPASGECHKLEHVVTLLERLLQRESPQRYRQPRQRHVGRMSARGPCAICGCDDHDTAYLCRSERLCIKLLLGQPHLLLVHPLPWPARPHSRETSWPTQGGFWWRVS